MPILYEETFQQVKKKKFAPVTDQTLKVTINLAAGKGTILSANAFDSTGKNVSKAYPGQGIGFYVSIQNTGDTDTIWADIKDADTGAVLVRTDGIQCAAKLVMNAGTSWGWTAANANNFVMPPKTLNLLVEAGHGT